MCREGAWLNGRSKLAKAANSRRGSPWVAGRANENFSGNNRKQEIATICAVTTRRTWRSSSFFVRQTKTANT